MHQNQAKQLLEYLLLGLALALLMLLPTPLPSLTDRADTRPDFVLPLPLPPFQRLAS
jgi:hypothetical protein